MAPREYVLHGLILGIDWAPFWPLLASMYLVATPNPVFNCILTTVQVSPQRLLLSGWLLTNVQVNITTVLHDASTHVQYIHQTSTTIHVLLYVHFFHASGQAGYPSFPLSVTNTYFYLFSHININLLKYFHKFLKLFRNAADVFNPRNLGNFPNYSRCVICCIFNMFNVHICIFRML